MEEYIELLGSCIAKLRPDIIVHRLTGDGPKELLIAPLWTSAKRTVLNRFHQYLKQQDIWQERIIMSETFTLYKLIILYMLNKVDFPLTTSQISEFVLDKGYTTYFKLQEAISELTQSELIRTETTHNRTLYHLTESGAETIHYFSNKISSAIRKDIDDFLTEKQYDLKKKYL